MEKSAMAEKSKISSLSQDLIRRLQNTNTEIGQGRKNEIVENYIQKLRYSGYRKVQIREIIQSGLMGFLSKVRRCQEQGQGLHRSAASTLTSRYKKKILAKTNWYKNRSKTSGKGSSKTKRKGNKKIFTQSQVKAVLFVPRTKGGELAKKLRTEEEKLEGMTGYRLKIVERSGKQVRREFCKSNPWAGSHCQRSNCLVCQQEGGGDCKKRGILYKTTCNQCKGTDKEASYIGESARSGYERGLNHQNDYDGMEFDSHMLKHQILSHGELQEKLTFSMKILKVHTSAFMRQVHEAVAIEMNEKNNILNSKGGFNRCKLPRLAIKMGQTEVKVGEKVEVMNDTEIEMEIERLRREKKVRKKEEKELERNQEPPRKRKKKWNVEKAKKRKNPEDENENPQECPKEKSMKTQKKSSSFENASQKLRPQPTDVQEYTIDQCSENLKPTKMSKTLNYFENLRKKHFNPAIDKDINFSCDNLIQPTCSLKPSSQVLNKGGGLRKSEYKANTAQSPSPSTNHQLKKKTRSSKKAKRPCYNYKPINQFFPPMDTEAIRKTAGNSDPAELIKAKKF